jgi:hypothetical protein
MILSATREVSAFSSYHLKNLFNGDCDLRSDLA